MKKSRLLFIPVFLILLTACPNEAHDNNQVTKLPERAENLNISWHNGGGMVDMSFNAYIQEDSAKWSYRRNGYETILFWSPSNDEINSFYSELKKSDFNKIQTTCKGEVYDRGGESILIEIGKTIYEIENSGNCFVDEKWKSEYAQLMNTFHEYLNQEISKQLLMAKIEIGDSLINSDYDIEINLEDGGRREFHPSKDTTSIKLDFYPGYNQFIVMLNYKDSSNYYGSPVNYKIEPFYEIVSDSTQSFLFDLDGDEITLNVKN